MKLKFNNTNTPVWRNVTVKTELPGKLKKLEELSKNLWWVWNSEGKTLFHDLDRDLWRATGENPVMMLQKMKAERFEEIVKDKQMMQRIDDVYEKFQAYMKVPMRNDLPSVSYFSMEYGLCNALKIYSGGLGILAGDYIKEASDRCVNMTAVGFLYRYGYFTQTLSMDGQQIANYEPQNFNQLPIEPVLDKNGQQMVLEVPYPGRVIYANIWRVNVGRMSLYLLDTDLDLNSEYDRPITHKLYGGDWENRIKQEYLLGIGGVLMLKKLGIKHEIYHCNEGHAALLNLQRLVDYVQEEKLSFNEALEMVRSSSLYTVHTPVPAGHDYFDEGLFGKYMGGYAQQLGISWGELMDMGRTNPGDAGERFCMSTFACNTCQEVNGVSWLHGEVSKKMFAGIWKGYYPEESHVGYVTNGVHMPTWAAKEWQELYAKYFDKELFGKYMGGYPQVLGISWKEFIGMGRINPEDDNERFCMSTFACNTCQEVNGVSMLHGWVSQKMFASIWNGYYPEENHVGYVTNGVHFPSWCATEWRKVYDKYLGKGFYDDQSNEDL
ncbi:MAG: alpha-glucan family phosphorylase, partial [Muribaculaceae bacterium]|nr:alpha-glucan family phosphorylase [Muribaculaceae bacterium]